MAGKSIQESCRALMAAAEVVYFSSVDEQGWPHIRAMSNLRNAVQFPRLTGFFDRHRDDFLVCLTTNRLSTKMSQIGQGPRVGLYYCNAPGVHGLLLCGMVEIVDDPKIRRMLWHDEWIQFYQGGLAGDDYTVLKVAPSFASGWYNGGRFEFEI